MASLEDLITPWLVPVLVAIVAAAASAIFTVWSNIRQKAWLAVYEEKRREIRAFLQTADQFASVVVHGSEVKALDQRPLADQIAAIMFLTRLKWGPDPEQSRDPLGRIVRELLPTRQEVNTNSPEAVTKVRHAKQALLNAFDEELQYLNLQMGTLRTTLALSLRDPDLTQRAQEFVAQVYLQIHNTKPAYEGFDADKFAEKWSKEMTPVKLALREDLLKSSRSLRAATGLTWRWRYRHSRLGKWMRKEGTTRIMPKLDPIREPNLPPNE